MTNNLKRAIDTDLSRLRVTEQARAAILENALEGKKVKKKLSVAFILVMTLILAAAVALAVTLINNQYFTDVAMIESEHGFYEDWSLKVKLSMLQLMKDYGVDVNQAETDALLKGGMPDEEREKRIDALVIERYGINGRIDVITLESVLAKELGGGIETWSMEQKAWYSQMLIDTGLMGLDDDIFRMPGEGVITPDEAIAVGTAEIMRVWGFSEEDIKQYATEWLYLTHTSDKEEKWLHYEIILKPVNGKGHRLHCQVAGDGRVLSSADNDLFCSPEEEKALYADLENSVDFEARELYQQYATEHGFNKPVGEPSLAFQDWPLEHKMAFCNLVRPVVLKNMAENPNYADAAYMFYAKHVYGVPDERSITQDEAYAIARRTLQDQLELSDALLAYCDTCYVYYEVTDPNAPLWKMLFIANKHWDEVKALGAQPNRFYRVVMNAHTGEIVEAFSFVGGDGVTDLEVIERQR